MRPTGRSATRATAASDEIVALAKGCDVLIHMNHYFSGTAPSPAYRAACGNHRDNALTAKRAGVKTLVLTHQLGQIDQPRIREQIVHGIQQVFDGKVVWGEGQDAAHVRRSCGDEHRGVLNVVFASVRRGQLLFRVRLFSDADFADNADRRKIGGNGSDMSTQSLRRIRSYLAKSAFNAVR
jgi:hypothetical protein